MITKRYKTMQNRQLIDFLNIKILLLALFISTAFLSPALANSVDIKILKGEAIAGEDLSFAISFDLDDESETIDISKAQYNGKALPHQVRSQSTSSFTMVINGKTVKSSSGVVKQYIFSIPTQSPGDLVIPEFPVYLGDKEYRVDSMTFKVLPKPTSENLKLLVEINNQQPYYYPSQVIELKCKILFRNFPGSPGIENISLPIMKDLSFELIPDPNPNFELIINQERVAVRENQGTENYKGKTYKYFSFNLKFRLMRPGNFEFNNSLKMIAETGKRYRQRSLFFGSEIVNETKPVFADSAPLKISVLELPRENIPPSFNGAIGTFKIKVTPSSDTAIRVGDPITLLIEISGRGTWEFVKSPPIHKDPNITDYFIVSQEPVIGEVNQANTMKSFSVRLRVKSKTVKEIPAIPFTYFNLATRKYVTVYSEPVPITVFDTSSTAKVIDYSTPAVPTVPETEQGTEIKPTESTDNMTKGVEEEQSPVLPPLIQIADNVPTSKTLENHAPVYKQLLLAVVFLIGVLVLALFILYRHRNISEKEIAQERSKKAYKNFLSELKNLDLNSEKISSIYSQLGQSIHKYLEERFTCKLISLDEVTLKPILSQHNIDGSTAQNLFELIDEVDQHRYSPAAPDKNEALQLIELSKKTIKKCD